MQKRYHMLAISTLCLVLFFSSYSTATTSQDQKLVDLVITRWHAAQQPSRLEANTKRILDRLETARTDRRYNAERFDPIFDRISFRLTNILRALDDLPLLPSTDTPTPAPNPQLNLGGFPMTMTTPQTTPPNVLLVAGQQSPLIREIRYTMSNEPLFLETLTIQTSSNDTADRIDRVALYDGQGRLLQTQLVADRMIRFSNINIEQPAGTSRLYIALQATKTDDLTTLGTKTFTLQFGGLEGRGVFSQAIITSTQQQGSSSPVITIAPVGISSVTFADARNSYQANTRLTSLETTLGILHVQTPTIQSQFDQTIFLDSIDLQIADNTVAQQLGSSLRLERLDIPSTGIAGTVHQTNVIRFSLAQLGIDASRISQGSDAYFRVYATVPLTQGQSESVQIRLRNMHNGAISYRLSPQGQPITLTAQSPEELFGPQIYK